VTAVVLASSPWGYVLGGWAVAGSALTLYALWLVARIRRLDREAGEPTP
jgi:hypothetical protein